MVQSEGFSVIDIPQTLKHIELLFTGLECNDLDMKQKFSLVGSLEFMLNLYKYQENSEPFLVNMKSMLVKTQLLIKQAQESQNIDLIKTSFQLTEVMMAIDNEVLQEMTHMLCMQNLYEVVDANMLNMNADIMALNASLKQDSLQLTIENPLVVSIMAKMDLVNNFIRMVDRVLNKLTNTLNNIFPKGYHILVQNPFLAAILVKVFGIGIQIPNSPNNNSVINITGLQILDNIIN